MRVKVCRRVLMITKVRRRVLMMHQASKVCINDGQDAQTRGHSRRAIQQTHLANLFYVALVFKNDSFIKSIHENTNPFAKKLPLSSTKQDISKYFFTVLYGHVFLTVKIINRRVKKSQLPELILNAVTFLKSFLKLEICK